MYAFTKHAQVIRLYNYTTQFNVKNRDTFIATSTHFVNAP